MKLYFDACCLSRLTDVQSQERVRKEAEAVEAILRLIGLGQASWVSSIVLEIEAGRNPNADQGYDVRALLAFANQVVAPGPGTTARAATIQSLGFGAFDALHLACAEQGQVEVFLTTDDDLLRRAGRYSKDLRISVQNPVSWYWDVYHGSLRNDE